MSITIRKGRKEDMKSVIAMNLVCDFALALKKKRVRKKDFWLSSLG